MKPIDEINNIILRKYITKHYRLIKITKINPMSKTKCRLEYDVYDKVGEKEITSFSFTQYLCKLFSVDIITVKRALNGLASEELARLESLQTSMDYEGHSN